MSEPAISVQTARQLGFSLEELALNRMGRMSDAQHSSLLWGLCGELCLGLILLGACVLCMVFGFRYNLFWTLKWMPLLAIPLVVLFALAPARDTFKAYATRSVQMTEGPISIVRVRASHSIQIENQRFGVDHPELLEAGTSYRVYHTANGQRLLSLEPSSALP